MKKYIFVAMFWCAGIWASLLHAQYSLTTYPPPNDFTFDDLWHFSLSGPVQSDYKQFYIAMRVFNEQGNLIIKSNSSVFTFNTAVMYIDKMNVGSTIGPLNTLYYDNTYQLLVSTGDFFPAGSYHIVFNLLGRPNDGEFTDLAEAEMDATVQMFMPPILIYPEDKDTIDTQYPLLTWLPAYQASSGQQITYHLYLTEMYNGQTAQQSITANPVYFEQYEIPITAIPYPANANNIELNHTYAWQVAATIGGIPVGYSQIWQFTYALPQPVITEVADYKQYYTFFKELNGAIVPIKENSIRMRIEEKYYNYNEYLKFNIYNEENKVVASSTNLNIELVNGVRYVEIPLCGRDVELEKNKTYLVEILNIKQEKRYLRIKILFDKNNCE